jgi:hypothetical protein
MLRKDIVERVGARPYDDVGIVSKHKGSETVKRWCRNTLRESCGKARYWEVGKQARGRKVRVIELCGLSRPSLLVFVPSRPLQVATRTKHSGTYLRVLMKNVFPMVRKI